MKLCYTIKRLRVEGLRVVDIHEVRSKRTGTSIVNSSIRAGVTKKRTHLYESAVELQAP